MLTENRKYDFIGELIINRSYVMSDDMRPKDDVVNWLFLKIDVYQFSFVYQIINPSEANYDSPFLVNMAFTVNDSENLFEFNCEYEVFRGPEKIGYVRLIDVIE